MRFLARSQFLNVKFADYQTFWWIRDRNKCSLCAAAFEGQIFFFLLELLTVQHTLSVNFKVLQLWVTHAQDGDQDT